MKTLRGDTQRAFERFVVTSVDVTPLSTKRDGSEDKDDDDDDDE